MKKFPMPPVNLLDPYMDAWLAEVSTVIRLRDGRAVAMPPTHWPCGQPVTYIGVVAQDIETTHPDAVVSIDGLLAVDYSRLRGDH